MENQILSKLMEIEKATLLGAKDVFTMKDTAMYTGLSLSHLYKLCCAKKIPHWKSGGGKINSQLKADVTAKTLYDELFYQSIIKRWYDEFKSIQKLKNHSFMIENITTIKDAEIALFSYLLQQSGQNIIDEFLNDLRVKNTFKERQRYSELKKKLNVILTAPTGEQSDLMQELETTIYNVAKYAR